MTEDITNVQVVAAALFQLGGAELLVDTEDVAIRAAAIAPGRFAWTKHKSHIDKELVRVALSDGKKAENGRLVAGTGSTGWHLTPAGVSVARKLVEGRGLGGQAARSPTARRTKSVAQQRASREEEHVIRSAAWEKWADGDRKIQRHDAEALFRVDVYADRRMIELKVNRLILSVEGKPELSELVVAASRVLMQEPKFEDSDG